ncbi:hypothetical protein [Sabulibacter ruber]|uniref:hypothetical protein n=1 Tax=Sabulibacter ruber TaxID=2811901 RepID=UPI001A95DA5F|nr:hypothetical protein [Sabulibacter ruber]
MKPLAYTRIASGAFALFFPVLVGCSVLPGGTSYSSDPVVAEQQRRIETLRAELKQAERDTEYAEEREKAAKSKLKAAEDELKVLKTAAGRRNG